MAESLLSLHLDGALALDDGQPLSRLSVRTGPRAVRPVVNLKLDTPSKLVAVNNYQTQTHQLRPMRQSDGVVIDLGLVKKLHGLEGEHARRVGARGSISSVGHRTRYFKPPPR